MQNIQLIELKNITGASLGCGWLHDEPATLLRSLIIYSKPEIVVQTGHLWGKSALIILQALEEMYSSPVEEQNAHELFESFVNENTPNRPVTVPQLHSIDPYCLHVPNAKSGIDYLNGKYSNFNFYGITSAEFFATFSLDKSKRIFGFVDGDHSYLGAYEDMFNLAQLGAEIIVLDDTSWIPFLRRAAKRIATRYGYILSEFPNYNGTIILIKRRNLNSPYKNIWTSLLYEIFCTFFGLTSALYIRSFISSIKSKLTK
jgi:hypothetical protein